MYITSIKASLCALNFSIIHFSRLLLSFRKETVASLMLNAKGVESRPADRICFIRSERVMKQALSPLIPEWPIHYKHETDINDINIFN